MLEFERARKKRENAHRNFSRSTLQLILRLEIFLQVLDELLRRCGGRVTLHRFAIFIDNKFREIPLDGIEERSTLLLLQILPQGMRLLAVHVDLLEQIEVDFTIFHETLDFLGVAWLLIAELIAGKGENSQSCKEEEKFN